MKLCNISIQSGGYGVVLTEKGSFHLTPAVINKFKDGEVKQIILNGSTMIVELERGNQKKEREDEAEW